MTEERDRCYQVSIGRPDMTICYRGPRPPSEADRVALAEIAEACRILMAEAPERCLARDRNPASSGLLPCLRDPGHAPPHRTGTGREWVDETPIPAPES